ncbi:MAG: ABC transporter ATP-binding protein [Pirellulales bacterium]|nr:ABC transporter ATP-binding protein [Pirellulales bacterium]
MTEVAPELNLRADQLQLELKAAIGLVRGGAPLARISASDAGELEWLLVVDHRGGKLEVVSSHDPDHAHWLTPKELRQRVGASDEPLDWISLQGLLPCDLPADRSRSPLSRFVGLLRPDRGDIGVILVFAVVVGLLTLSTPIAVEALVNTVAFGRLLQPVVVLAVILLVFLGFSAALRALQTYIAEIIQQRIYVRVSADLSQRLPRVQTEFWDHHYGPEFVNRFFDVVTVQKVTSQLLLDGVALALQTFVGMTVIAFYHPLLLGFDLILLAIVAGIVLVLGRGAVKSAVDESKYKYRTAAWLQELARHRTTFHGRSSMKFALDVADRQVTNYLLARQAHFRVLMRQIVAALGLQAIASTVLLGLGGWLVIQGELTLGQLVAAELIVTVIVGSFAKIGKHVESYYDVVAAADKLGYLFDMPINRSEGVDLPVRGGGISVALNSVGVESAGGLSKSAANLRLAPGEQAVLVGGAASDRTRLLETIVGLRAPASGYVELDGFDARRLRIDSILDQAALVGRIEIFEGSVAENLHLGRPQATEARVRQALATVELRDELLAMPEGLDASVTTGGHELSYDQHVRLMLARALAGNPRMLLIDGLLDGLPDPLLAKILPRLSSTAGELTLIISTGRREVAAALSRVVNLDPSQSDRRFPLNGRDEPGAGD